MSVVIKRQLVVDKRSDQHQGEQANAGAHY